MLNVKKIAKGVGVVALVFFLAVLGYVFTPFLALLILAMQSITAVLIEVVILLIILSLTKVLLQFLTGKKIEIKVLNRLMTRIPRIKKKTVEQ